LVFLRCFCSFGIFHSFGSRFCVLNIPDNLEAFPPSSPEKNNGFAKHDSGGLDGNFNEFGEEFDDDRDPVAKFDRSNFGLPKSRGNDFTPTTMHRPNSTNSDAARSSTSRNANGLFDSPSKDEHKTSGTNFYSKKFLGGAADKAKSLFSGWGLGSKTKDGKRVENKNAKTTAEAVKNSKTTKTAQKYQTDVEVGGNFDDTLKDQLDFVKAEKKKIQNGNNKKSKKDVDEWSLSDVEKKKKKKLKKN
jgi:hypothetical protein